MYLLKDKRIQLRNELFKEFKQLNIITKKHIKNNERLQITKKRLINSVKNDNDLLQKYNLYIEQFRSEKEALYCLLHNDDYENHLCCICNNICRYNELHYKYNCTCSNKECLNKVFHSEEIKEKIEKTCIKKYGVKKPFQSNEIQNKAEKTFIKKYGVKRPFQSNEIQNKVIQTCIKRYGVENVFQSEKIKERIKKTNLKRYNVEYASQSKEFQNKVHETSLKKYGVNHFTQSEKIKERVRDRYIIKNTFNNPIKNNDVKKCINKVKEYYNIDIKLNNIYSNNEYFVKFIKTIYIYKNRLLRLNEIKDIFHINRNSIKERASKLNLLKYFFIRDSNLELQFKNFLDNNNINNYIRHYRGLKLTEDNGRPEIDFLIDDNIGIEINDIASHNKKYKDQKYHYNKTMSAQEKGIRLIHLWEWELTNEKIWNKVSKWILNLLNNNKIKIGARKCIIKEISLKEEKEFLNEYHLQEYIKSEKCYGLYYNNELIQIMSFGISRYNKNYQWELLRLCTKYGYIIIGGAHKLLKYFIKNNNPISIISYCNLDKFTGNIYENLGFTLLKRNQPSATWYNQETEDYFLDSSLLKLGADKLLKTNFGKNTNNEEIVYKNGYQKVYNCGINVYMLKI